MSRADGVLSVVLRQRPFEDILAGVKREEYRRDKPGSWHWAEKILSYDLLCSWGRDWVYPEVLDEEQPNPENWFHPYHTLAAGLGYAHDRPTLRRRITGIRWGLPNPAWTCGIVSPGPCFVIELGGDV